MLMLKGTEKIEGWYTGSTEVFDTFRVGSIPAPSASKIHNKGEIQMTVNFVPPEEFEYAPEFCKDCPDYQKGCATCEQLISLKQDLAKWKQDVYGIDE